MTKSNTIEEPMAKTADIKVRVKDSKKERLQQMADRDDRTLSYVVERAIDQHIATDEEEIRGIKEAMAQADRGELIADADVQAWIESWDTETELPKPEPQV